MEATGWDPTLRSLARGSDLFSGPAGGGLASGAMTVWNRLHRGDNVRAIQTELLSLQAAQVLQDHRFAILRDLLPGHPETQRDLPRLLEALNKRAIPLVTLQDADESPFRLGSRQGQLFVADPDRTAGLRDVLPGVRTEDSADTHRITLALTVEPFSLRALSSVLRLEDLTGQA
ncbi:MAG: hypothetical protein NTZ05_17825 [Chloroflexi bacterium]|nr:hypothetical protein [Chloroflexota bacterium]